MIHSYTADQIRIVERRALAEVGDGPLMRRAARAVAGAAVRHLASPVPGRSVVLLVGGGNNGGDALYAGAFLRRRSVAVTAVMAAPGRAHASGLEAFRRAGGRVCAAGDDRVDALIARADLIVDGLVGIGARPPLRAPMDDLVVLASSAAAWRIAVDVPSGLDPDTGRTVGPVFAADTTVTIGGVKTGLLLSDAVGDVQVASIGMDPADHDDVAPDAATFTDADAAALVPLPQHDSDKYSLGVPGIAAGSARYPGAAMLAIGGAVRSRPGLVRYAGPCGADVIRAWPEVVATSGVREAGRVQSWAVGPGIGTDGSALALLRDVLAVDMPVVVDADGLNLLADHPEFLSRRAERGAATILTPHRGEFTRLFGGLDPDDRLAATRAAARRSGAVVLLKGHRTIIAGPDGRAVVNTVDSPWLATAGSGDILAGMVASALATGLDPLLVAAAAAHRHGRAGQRAEAAGPAGASALAEMLGVAPHRGAPYWRNAGPGPYGSIGG